MDSSQKQDPGQPGSGANYNYNYGTAYSGYSAIGYGESAAQRTFQDYLLILRERLWYIVVVFLVVLSSVLVYTLTQTPLYQSTATVQIFRRDPTVMQVQQVMDNQINSAEDLNTQVNILESGAIVQKVADRLTGDDLRQFMAPYVTASGDQVTPQQVLASNRKVVPQRLSLILAVQYQHPNPQIAAKVANLFVDEYISYNSRMRIDEAMKAVEDLRVRADDQRKKVDDIANALQAYREKNNLVSLDQRQDIVTEKLKALNLYVTQTTTKLRDAETRWQQVQTLRQSGGNLLDLPLIAGSPLVAQLQQQVAAQKITVAQLSQRYRPEYPTMIEAVKTLTEAQSELQRAINTTAAQIETDYRTALQSDTDARAALTAQEADSLKLGRYSVDYTNMQNDYAVNEQVLAQIMGRMRETSMSSTIENQNARIVDRAGPALAPASPNYLLNISLGVVGGLGVGLAFAFFVAFIDDRVKSSFDIESVVGLPLIGIIPEIKRMEQADKAQIVVNNADRQVSEAFLTLHSGLRLKDESKNAQCILITSTIPGEGKSFLTTNLALTFAAHGERTIIVDCDLRKPNIHKSFRVENLKGLIDICTGAAKLDEVLIKNLQPNLDILPAGGRAKNPTQILNSKNFEILLSDLRKRYDRVFIDTPPLAAVSDALIILPLVDGSIFSIFFNKVRRKAAQFCAKRLLDANVPSFGAVLNGLNLAVSGYYYAQYYDKSYKDYYVVVSKEDEKELK